MVIFEGCHWKTAIRRLVQKIIHRSYLIADPSRFTRELRGKGI